MSAGTLTLTNNTDAVTGTGTTFTSELVAGDFIVAKVGGITYTLPIKTVGSDTQVVLVSKYPGPSLAGIAWQSVPRESQNQVTAELVAQTTAALRGLNYDKQNWQAVFSASGDITITLPDGSSFSGPSWKKIAELLEAIDESALQALATQVHNDAQQVATDKAAAASAASTATQAKTDSQTARSASEAAASGAASSNQSAAQHASDAGGSATAAAASATAAANSAASIHPENLLQKANNLSELADKSTARANLDVYSKDETDAKAGGGGSYIGQSWWHDMRSKMPDGCVASDGQQVDQAGPFADLYADVAAGNRPTCTEAEWQADPTKRNCYVLNSSTGKMRLPDRNGVQPGSIKAPVMRGDGGTLTAGSMQKSGVPNVAGEISGIAADASPLWDGAVMTPPFKVGGQANKPFSPQGFASNGNGRVLLIDLSTSSDAYVTGLTEVRVNSNVGCFVIRYAGRAQNAGSLDAMTLSARMESINTDLLAKNVATNARLGSAVIDAGSLTGNNQVITLTNPYGANTPVGVTAEIQYNGVWCDVGWIYSSAGTFGVRAMYVEGQGIVVKTGSALSSVPNNNGHILSTPDNYKGPANCRVLVRKISS